MENFNDIKKFFEYLNIDSEDKRKAFLNFDFGKINEEKLSDNIIIEDIFIEKE